jgi:hypothetical protein
MTCTGTVSLQVKIVRCKQRMHFMNRGPSYNMIARFYLIVSKSVTLAENRILDITVSFFLYTAYSKQFLFQYSHVFCDLLAKLQGRVLQFIWSKTYLTNCTSILHCYLVKHWLSVALKRNVFSTHIYYHYFKRLQQLRFNVITRHVRNAHI